MKMFTYKLAQDEVTHQRLRVGSKKHALSLSKGPSSKAAHGLAYPAGDLTCLTRGAYAEYVSTEKWRERRWRLFSTDPMS
jgi:hypothetical protein